MALLAVHGITAMSATTSYALPSHHHGAVTASFTTSSYALAGTAPPRARSTTTTTLATGLAVAPAPVLQVYCGRGDKKTKRGKRFNHSYGNARPRNKKKGTGPPRLYAPPAPPRKADQFDDGEVVPVDIDDDILES